MSIVISNKVRRYFTKNIGQTLHSPHQRFIQGVTALAIQPLIDFHNKKADDETRAVSTARTIGKIVAGTLTGVLIRAAFIAATRKFSAYKLEPNAKFITEIVKKSKKDIFTPNLKLDNPIPVAEFKANYDNHIKTMGNITATITMLFTNFLIDAPLTALITKILHQPIKNYIDKDSHSNNKEVKNASC